MSQFYQAFNLRFDSDIHIPEWPACDTAPGMEADVTIRTGPVPDRIEQVTGDGVCYQLNPTQCRYDIKGIARYYAEAGRHILVEPYPEADESAVQQFLTSLISNVILHQRGMLPLHGAAVETSDGAVLFCGPSGVGKSTTARLMAQRGYRIITDDVSVFSMDENGKPEVTPGPPCQKLWADTLEQLDIPADDLPRIRPQLEKYLLSVETYDGGPQHISRMYLLNTHNIDEILFYPIKGMQRFNALNTQVRYRQLTTQMGYTKRNMPALTALAQHVALIRLTRPTTQPARLTELMDRIEADMGS